MDALSPGGIALLLGAGFAAGIVNTLAGGGSLLTVPLLVLLGLPGTLANGTNRIGVLLQGAVAAWRFRDSGILELRSLVPVLLPVLTGSLAGAFAIAQVSDATFERIFGAVMLVLLVPMLRRSGAATPGPGLSPALSALVFFAIGVYGGAVQAGVGIPLVFALVYAGHDLVRANAIKVAVVGALTAAAVPVFAFQGKIAWAPGAVLALGFAAGAEVGVRLALRAGARLIRPVLAACVVALAGRMLGFY
jgi:hypothetical protein